MIEQGSMEWRLQRCGKATGSRISDICARTKSGWGASRRRYMGQLTAERQSGVPFEGYKSKAMQGGTEREPDARAAYEFKFDRSVELVGFVPHPKIAMSGASPDGLVETDGMIEIKCPEIHTHIETLLTRQIDGDYLTQIQWGLACTGRKWCDYISFSPELSERKKLWVGRVNRDDARIKELEGIVTEFLKELDANVAELDRLYPEPTEKAA